MTAHEQGIEAACHLCGCPDFGSYDGQVAIVAPDWLKERWPNGIGIDVCLALEIQRLWRRGIRTTGHCCGHGRSIGYIGVDEASIKTMKSLGYTVRKNDCDPVRDDCFVPKSLGTSMTADINRVIDQIETWTNERPVCISKMAPQPQNVTALIKACAASDEGSPQDADYISDEDRTYLEETADGASQSPHLSSGKVQLLEWLGKEEFSLYGECKGEDLDTLVRVGFAEVGTDDLESNKDWAYVRLTDAGRSALAAAALATKEPTHD